MITPDIVFILILAVSALAFFLHRSQKNSSDFSAKTKESKIDKEVRWAKTYGREITSVTLRLVRFTVLEDGFVAIGNRNEPEKLMSVDANGDNLQKKSAAGRTAGAVLTGGLNLIGSNQRGDINLVIVTDKQIFSYPIESPSPAETAEVQKLVAACNAVIEANQPSSEGQDGTESKEQDTLPKQLEQLAHLKSIGQLTEKEYQSAKNKLLGENL